MKLFNREHETISTGDGDLVVVVIAADPAEQVVVLVEGWRAIRNDVCVS